MCKTRQLLARNGVFPACLLNKGDRNTADCTYGRCQAYSVCFCCMSELICNACLSRFTSLNSLKASTQKAMWHGTAFNSRWFNGKVVVADDAKRNDHKRVHAMPLLLHAVSVLTIKFQFNRMYYSPINCQPHEIRARSVQQLMMTTTTIRKQPN